MSLFERLYGLLGDLSEKDGIPRTVMLDTQYRMHPVLGEFVSRTFYECHGDKAIKWVRSAGEFAHGLHPYEDKVAAFIDVPRSHGSEGGRQSKYRIVEARRVAEEAHRLADLRPDLSIGIITFYRQQVDFLWEELVRQQMAVPLGPREWQVAEGYRHLPAASGRVGERLRVGTVDAFQGMEFDVVLLSMTRSNAYPAGEERQNRRKFGRLMLDNLNCVAMSRQQRLLIVIGDREMLRGDASQKSLKAMTAFDELCGGPHGIRL